MGYKDIDFKQDSKFLVTGAAGFIGSNLCEAILNLGYSVVGLDDLSNGNIDNISSFINNPNFSFIKGDIRDIETCLQATKNIDYVLHQAAWGSVPRSVEMPLIYEEINVKGTLNMLEASRLNKVKRFVYASSSSVYGDEPNLPKKEGKEGNLLSPYAVTKKVNEDYAKLYTSLYGLETIGLRYFNVFGRRQNPNGDYAAVIPKFIQLMLKNESPIINGDGTQSRDFTFIENVIEANLKSCIAPSLSCGRAYNVAFCDRIDLNELMKVLNLALDKTIKAIYGPNRKGDIKHSLADISDAKEMLDYQPDWSFHKGIDDAIEWYRENL